MKKTILMNCIMLFAIISTSLAQKTTTKAPVKTQTASLKKVIELVVPEGSGTNSGSVVWHPVNKKYYTSMIGNADYPFLVFSGIGKCLSASDIATGVDVRGLWYNPKIKMIQGNGYDAAGWFNVRLDPNQNNLKEVESLFTDIHQPIDNSLGVYVPKLNQVLFYQENTVYYYDMQGNEVKNKYIDNVDLLASPDDYNTSFIINDKGEIGLANFFESQIEWYNIETSQLVKKIPVSTDVKIETMFNFSYANGIYWFFDKENRKWVGCK